MIGSVTFFGGSTVGGGGGAPVSGFVSVGGGGAPVSGPVLGRGVGGAPVSGFVSAGGGGAPVSGFVSVGGAGPAGPQLPTGGAVAALGEVTISLPGLGISTSLPSAVVHPFAMFATNISG